MGKSREIRSSRTARKQEVKVEIDVDQVGRTKAMKPRNLIILG